MADFASAQTADLAAEAQQVVYTVISFVATMALLLLTFVVRLSLQRKHAVALAKSKSTLGTVQKVHD